MGDHHDIAINQDNVGGLQTAEDDRSEIVSSGNFVNAVDGEDLDTHVKVRSNH